MSGVFNLFDFQKKSFNHQMCFKPNNNNSTVSRHEHEHKPQKPIQGVEAPRNSLESEEEGDNETFISSSSEMKEEDFGFPNIGIRVHTKVGTKEGHSEFSSSESSNSPCIKTPSLVARLMGLDSPLPDQSPTPPSSTSSIPGKTIKTHRRYQYLQESINARGGRGFDSRSLPDDTPRISSARKSDVYFDARRLSLQINKENDQESDYFSSRSSIDSVASLNSLILKKKLAARKRGESNEPENVTRSPSHYARQIVKQVKESVSRKMGRDITNITTSKVSTTTRKSSVEPELVTVIKPKRPSSRLNRNGGGGNDQDSISSSCSPRLRFLETKNVNNKSLVSSNTSSTTPRAASVLRQDQCDSLNSPRLVVSKANSISPPKPLPLPPPPLPKPTTITASRHSSKPKLPQHQTMEKCKKASCERFTQRKEKSSLPNNKSSLNLSAHKKCKKSISPSPSSPLAEDEKNIVISTKSVIHSNSTSFLVRYDNHRQREDKLSSEFRYVSRILKCTGIESDTVVSITRWFSPSHPLDPSMFNHLENFYNSTTSSTNYSSGHHQNRSNRRLLFNLVDEILVDILRPYLNMKPWMNTTMNNYLIKKKKLMRGDQLLKEICKQIEKSPCAYCLILQDIDALIEKDLPPNANLRTVPVLEEGESIVCEIERDILDSLVDELALMAFHS
ncbi:hypothetical protein MKW98_006549 [Papaver atlanticum]|uniref:DUF4378 domain-containing protein n=1 Tax=Papaver atlanticum TaxID=357466 RepID=A0AAD4XSM4_9MAGN|nr:hypothetical protein MKW98_006549 [Papaver atlanticum]